MSYSTHYSRSTAEHRIANIYDVSLTLQMVDGSQQKFTKRVTVPWEAYHGESSSIDSVMKTHICLHLFNEETKEINFKDIKKQFPEYVLVDRVDQTNEMLETFRNEYWH